MMRRAKVPKPAMDALFGNPPFDYDAEFDEIRKPYPNQIGLKQARESYIRQRREIGDEFPRRMAAAMQNYLKFLERPDQREWRQPQNLKTFVNNWAEWEHIKQEAVCPFPSREACHDMRAGGSTVCLKHNFKGWSAQ